MLFDRKKKDAPQTAQQSAAVLSNDELDAVSGGNFFKPSVVDMNDPNYEIKACPDCGEPIAVLIGTIEGSCPNCKNYITFTPEVRPDHTNGEIAPWPTGQ